MGLPEPGTSELGIPVEGSEPEGFPDPDPEAPLPGIVELESPFPGPPEEEPDLRNITRIVSLRIQSTMACEVDGRQMTYTLP